MLHVGIFDHIFAQYVNFSGVENKNQESEIANISAATSETKIKILPVSPSNSNTIFPGHHSPVRKVLLQDAKISIEMQEKSGSLIHAFKYNMSSSSNDITYTKFIVMDIETDLNLPPFTYNLINSLLNIKSGLEKRCKI